MSIKVTHVPTCSALLNLRGRYARDWMWLGLLLSVLAHVLLLSLTFGDEEIGLPGFGFPWQDRRGKIPVLRVVLEPATLSSTQPQPMTVDGQAASNAPTSTPTPTPEPAPQLELQPGPVAESPSPAAAVRVLPAESALNTYPYSQPKPQVEFAPGLSKPLNPNRGLVSNQASTPYLPSTPALVKPAEVERPETRSEAAALQEATLLSQLRQEALQIETARQESIRQQLARQLAIQQELSQQQALQREATRQEAAREAALRDAALVEVARAQAMRAEASRLEAERQQAIAESAARQDIARQETVRQELLRQEATRQEALRQEAARQEAVRQQAMNQATAQQEASRKEADAKEAAKQALAKQETARQDAMRQEEGQAEAARLAAIRAAADQREERLKAIGQQLNEEADRRAAAAAARPSSTLPSSWSSARRGRIFGRGDANAELLRYAEAWSRKIELNMTIDAAREAAKQTHTNPVVMVAVRSDGSVESVSFVRSSGSVALDDAIRSIVQSQANYPAFQPALARDFDVIEIRRTWHFDIAIRLY